MNNCMNISIWFITNIMMKLSTIIEYMHNFGGDRSDLFNSGGRWSKGGGGRDLFKIQGGSWLKGDS